MPELGEVSYYARQWAQQSGQRVEGVLGKSTARVFREEALPTLKKALLGKKLLFSQRRAKWASFKFSQNTWLSIHLGMSGSLQTLTKDKPNPKHAHLLLKLSNKQSLAFVDPRMFGKVLLDQNAQYPQVWNQFGLELSDPHFTQKHFETLLKNRQNAPAKKVLLEQDKFPGIGNWMADEILFRSKIHPARKISDLTAQELKRLFKESLYICKHAEKRITRQLNDIPRTWLFWKRWDKALGACPQTSKALQKITVAGRSSVFSPFWQN